MKQLGIIGCGWLGSRIAISLKDQYRIVSTTTSEERYRYLSGLGFRPELVKFEDEEALPIVKRNSSLTDSDTLIVAIPFSKKTGHDRLLGKLRSLIDFIGDFDRQVFFMSSIGVYLPTEGTVTEHNLPEDQLHPGLYAVENEIRATYPQVNILRLGGLMGDERYLSKYAVKAPNEIANHIHYTDIAGVVRQMIVQEMHSSVFNVVAPVHRIKQAILDFQLGHKIQDGYPVGSGRIVSSEKLRKELGYEFVMPDPMFFHSPSERHDLSQNM